MSPNRLVKRSKLFLSLCIMLATSTALAQGGPPPEVRRAVTALVDAITANDDATLDAFIAKAADPAWVATSGNTTIIDTLRRIRAATQGLGDELSVEPAPDGVRVTLGAAGVSRTIAMGLSPAGVNALELVPATGSAPPAAKPSGIAGATQGHIAALERSGHRTLDEVVSEFETGHFSVAYMANTTSKQRREVLDRIRSVAANAGGLLLDESDGEVILTMRGPQSLSVVFKVEPQAPFGIDALRTEEAAADEPAMTLTWKNAKKTFRQLEKDGFSGAVHLARDGKTVLHKAYGKSNRELGYKVQTDTIFGIGSTPIDFTVTGIYLLAQSGKLHLDDTLGKFFTNVPADKSAMTIAHLIGGQSGLPDFHGDAEQDWDMDLAWIDRDTAVARILAQPMLFAPGTGRAHSHSAYGLAAAIIEIVSGQGYFDFMQQHLFAPAGMTRTGMYGQAREFKVRDFAVGYANSSVGVPNIPPNWGPTSWLVMGSGGMYSTLEDMLRFYDYVRSGKGLEEQYASRYRQATVGIGGSDRGFYYFHATKGTDQEVMMLVNGEGRTPEMRALSEAMKNLLD